MLVSIAPGEHTGELGFQPVVRIVRERVGIGMRIHVIR